MGSLLLLVLRLSFITSAVFASPLSIDEPTQLQKLESEGLDFSRLVLGTSARIESGFKLKDDPLYRSLVSDLSSELDVMAKKDRSLSVGMASTHRLLNKAWFTSPSSRFELVGVVHRLDRAAFAPQFCGEIRFIYRLAYLTSGPRPIYSRLPVTVNAAYHLKRTNGTCQEAANKWKATKAAGSIASSPLQAFGIDRLKSVEVNLQSVRWPSTVRPDIGGYAEYLMKVYTLIEGRFVPSKMENMPDVELLSKNGVRKKRLLEWVTNANNLKRIDEGIAIVPDEYLAKRAVSVALAGPHRLANAPFTRLFSESDFAHLEFSGLRTIKSARGLLRRLNDLSCVGCHQGRTVAGFHFLGKDRSVTADVNSIHVSSSPHFLMDQTRRIAYFDAVADAKTPEASRAISVRSSEDRGVMGSHCGPGDPSFSSWTCAEGFVCTKVIDDSRVSPTGVCMPIRPAVGSSCISGAMKHSDNPHNDRVALATPLSCGPQNHCEAVSVGFPGGMCSGDCVDLEAGAICGSIAVLQGFNTCLAKGKDSFADCLRENVRPGSLQECSESKFCRDDFICARVGDRGGCIPPYFLFQLRADGHPAP